MLMLNNIILVGGFPKPIGGVTTFVRRLAASDNRIKEVVDLYYDIKKEIPSEYHGKYKLFSNKITGFIYLFLRMFTWREYYIHFNFSTLNSLILFILLPKCSAKWILMLHHGILESSLPYILTKYLLCRFDHIFCINEAQYIIYQLYGVKSDKLIRASSYVKPLMSKPDIKFQQDIDRFYSLKPTFIASGSPTSTYNLDWCIQFIGERKQYQLALFVYGDGSERCKIMEQVNNKYNNIRIFWDQSEANFNYALSKSFYYLRPNTIDSFGIAVADAVNYGVLVFASDVCPRFHGANTFKITTYEAFQNTLISLLNDDYDIDCTEAESFAAFSYDLIR